MLTMINKKTLSDHIADTFSVDHSKLMTGIKVKSDIGFSRLLNNGESQPTVFVSVEDDVISIQTRISFFWLPYTATRCEKVDTMFVKHKATWSNSCESSGEWYNSLNRDGIWYLHGPKHLGKHLVVFNTFEEAKAYTQAFIAECKALYKYATWVVTTEPTDDGSLTVLRPSKVTTEHLKTAFDLGLISLGEDHWIVNSNLGK